MYDDLLAKELTFCLPGGCVQHFIAFVTVSFTINCYQGDKVGIVKGNI